MSVTSLSLYRVHVLLFDPPLRSLDDCDLTQPLQGPCSAVRPSVQVSRWLWRHSASPIPCSLMLDPALRSLADCDLTQPLQGPCSAVRTSDQVSSWLRLSSISRRFSVERHYKCLFAALESAYLISWKWIEIYVANKQKTTKSTSQNSKMCIIYRIQARKLCF